MTAQFGEIDPRDEREVKPMVGIRPDCPTCEGPSRETINMACPTCGFDYGRDPFSLFAGEVHDA